MSQIIATSSYQTYNQFRQFAAAICSPKPIGFILIKGFLRDIYKDLTAEEIEFIANIWISSIQIYVSSPSRSKIYYKIFKTRMAFIQAPLMATTKSMMN